MRENVDWRLRPVRSAVRRLLKLFVSDHRIDHRALALAASGPPSQDYAKACGSTGPLQMFLFYIESPSTALQHLPARAHTGQ